jgi:hypothetical protein
MATGSHLVISIRIFRWNQFSIANLWYMFGAKGVISRRAWGNAPGFQSYHPASAESATQRMADETRFQR